MDRTQCTLMDVAKKIEKDFLLIGLPGKLKDILTSEEYETLRFASKGFLPDNCEENWDKLNRIYQKVQKVDELAAAPALNLKVLSAMSKNSKPKPKLIKLVGFESGVFKMLLKQVNEFISSDECGEFIDFDFKVTERNHHFVYSGFVKYLEPATSDDDSRNGSGAVKAFASEVRKTIEDTYQSLGGSERFNFCDHGLTLIEAVQNKLDEVLK